MLSISGRSSPLSFSLSLSLARPHHHQRIRAEHALARRMRSGKRCFSLGQRLALSLEQIGAKLWPSLSKWNEKESEKESESNTGKGDLTVKKTQSNRRGRAAEQALNNNNNNNREKNAQTVPLSHTHTHKPLVNKNNDSNNNRNNSNNRNSSINSSNKSSINSSKEKEVDEDALTLPAFESITLDRIVLVHTHAQLAQARAQLCAQTVVGFDTETKPYFAGKKGLVGPHLVQLSTLERTFLFSFAYPSNAAYNNNNNNNNSNDSDGSPSDSSPSSYSSSSMSSSMSSSFYNNARASDIAADCLSLCKVVLESPSILKVGFGLDFDTALLRKNLRVSLHNYVDLARSLRTPESLNLVGVKTGVKKYLGRYFDKNKRVTLSNWNVSLREMKQKQILYAANDSYAALLVYEAWIKEMVTENSNRDLSQLFEAHVKTSLPVEEIVPDDAAKAEKKDDVIPTA